MKKTLLIMVMLFTMILSFFLKVGQPSMNIASDEEDEVIEWHIYNDRLPI